VSRLEVPLTAGPLTTLSTTPGHRFGQRVATADVSGDGYPDAIVASPATGFNPTGAVGAVFIYLGTATGIETNASISWVAHGTPLVGDFGAALAVGDIDGDGISDLAIGAPTTTDSGGIQVGAVFVYRGRVGDGLAAPLDDWGFAWSLAGASPGSRFGAALAIGDIDGDGKNDVIVGAPDEGAGVIRAYRSLGATGLDPTPTSVTGAAATERLGAALAVADIDGDGRADIVAGAPHASTQAGAAVVFAGSPAGLSSTKLWSATGKAAAGRFGDSVAAADITGDGSPDVIVGEPSAGSGAVHVFTNKANGLAKAPGTSLVHGTTGARFGTALAVGDINGDTRADLVIGAPFASPGGDLSVYLGTPSGVGGTASEVRVGSTNAELGASVAIADFEADGFSDLLVGAPGADQALIFAGGCRSQLYYVDADGDGYGDASRSIVVDLCVTTAPAPGYAATSGDCIDTDSAINPGAVDLDGDSIDQNCDGVVRCYRDDDDDGSRAATGLSINSDDGDCDDPMEGSAGDPVDCDDANPSVSVMSTFYVDSDLDTHGSSVEVVRCGAGTGFATTPDDCNDSDASSYPGAIEIVGDSIDQDCDGQEVCFVDVDGDGYRPDAITTVKSADSDCADPGESALSAPTTDCNDAAAATRPGGTEICNGVDDDCDGVIDPLPLCSTPAVCGDGTVDAGETCDDGNTLGGDGCDPSCDVESMRTDGGGGGCSATGRGDAGGAVLVLCILAVITRRRAH
jgi:cysteine-rich repeat protein